jgi:hypothetical protein
METETYKKIEKNMEEEESEETEALTRAYSDPDVMRARVAFFNCAGVLSFTNYVDHILRKSLESAATLSRVDQLEKTYSDYMDALAPRQPSEAFLGRVYGPGAKRAPWDAPDPRPGDVFYFLPNSGGYWVSGKEGIKAYTNAARSRISREGSSLCPIS